MLNDKFHSFKSKCLKNIIYLHKNSTNKNNAIETSQHIMKINKQRTGYTTGSCAAAAATAALRAIMQQKIVDEIAIWLPKHHNFLIPIAKCEIKKHYAVCTVIKDGGDDPDVTHGAEIIVKLSLTDKIGKIEIDGGDGVGIVTKPGLGLELNKPAINPMPQKIIRKNLKDEASELLEQHGLRVVIMVPKGKELGPKTDNPRLGIIGGISILGTSGIVIPFSTASYAASIRQNLDVAVAMNENKIVLTTGGRSEEFAKKAIANLADHCFVQMGDFVGYSVNECAKRSAQFKQVYVVGFIGKLAKMAAGVKQTHVKGSKVDMRFLADLAKEAGAKDDIIQMIKKANTARHVAEIISNTKHAKKFFEILCHNVYKHMTKHVQSQKIPIKIVLFDFDGNILAETTAAANDS